MRAASLGHLNIFGQMVGIEAGASVGEPFLGLYSPALTPFAMTAHHICARIQLQEARKNGDNALREQKNQEKVEDDTTSDKDFEKVSATNESSAIMREEISSFLTKQVSVIYRNVMQYTYTLYEQKSIRFSILNIKEE